MKDVILTAGRATMSQTVKIIKILQLNVDE